MVDSNLRVGFSQLKMKRTPRGARFVCLITWPSYGSASLLTQDDTSLSKLNVIASVFWFWSQNQATGTFLSVTITFYAESLLRELSAGVDRGEGTGGLRAGGWRALAASTVFQ